MTILDLARVSMIINQAMNEDNSNTNFQLFLSKQINQYTQQCTNLITIYQTKPTLKQEITKTSN